MSSIQTGTIFRRLFPFIPIEARRWTNKVREGDKEQVQPVIPGASVASYNDTAKHETAKPNLAGAGSEQSVEHANEQSRRGKHVS